MQPLTQPATPDGLLAAMFLRDDPDARKHMQIELSPLLVALLASDDLSNDD